MKHYIMEMCTINTGRRVGVYMEVASEAAGLLFLEQNPGRNFKLESLESLGHRMITLIDEFGAKSNIDISLDTMISFKNISDARLKLYEAKKQIRELEKILTTIYDEYALSLE